MTVVYGALSLLALAVVVLAAKVVAMGEAINRHENRIENPGGLQWEIRAVGNRADQQSYHFNLLLQYLNLTMEHDAYPRSRVVSKVKK